MIIITNSSAFDKASYNQDTKKMTVEYKTGGNYTYDNISQDEVDSILSAQSRGSKLKEVIKGKSFTHN